MRNTNPRKSKYFVRPHDPATGESPPEIRGSLPIPACLQDSNHTGTTLKLLHAKGDAILSQQDVLSPFHDEGDIGGGCGTQGATSELRCKVSASSSISSSGVRRHASGDKFSQHVVDAERRSESQQLFQVNQYTGLQTIDPNAAHGRMVHAHQENQPKYSVETSRQLVAQIPPLRPRLPTSQGIPPCSHYITGSPMVFRV